MPVEIQTYGPQTQAFKVGVQAGKMLADGTERTHLSQQMKLFRAAKSKFRRRFGIHMTRRGADLLFLPPALFLVTSSLQTAHYSEEKLCLLFSIQSTWGCNQPQFPHEHRSRYAFRVTGQILRHMLAYLKLEMSKSDFTLFQGPFRHKVLPVWMIFCTLENAFAFVSMMFFSTSFSFFLLCSLGLVCLCCCDDMLVY